MANRAPTSLPLPFHRAVTVQNAAALPLAFLRKHGDINDSPVVIKRQQKPVGMWWFGTLGIAQMGRDVGGLNSGEPVASAYFGVTAEVFDVGVCQRQNVTTLWPIRTCQSHRSSWFAAMGNAFSGNVSILYGIRSCRAHHVDTSTAYATNMHSLSTRVQRLEACSQTRISGSTPYAVTIRDWQTQGIAMKRCIKVLVGVSRPIPGEFYPLPLEPVPPPPKPARPCGERPPGNMLPFALNRARLRRHPALLPFDFACKRKDSIPILSGYIMHNTVTATFDGQPLAVLSATPKVDMDSFCWQTSITLYPDDFVKLNMDGRDTGDEAQITLTINDEDFVFLAEDYSDNREFGKKTYTVTGRSLTAKLTADYAKTRNGTIDASLYARQIADQQLEFLPYIIAHWDIPDWLVPGGSYAINDKTPMDVLQDIAKAAGGYVYSHPGSAELSLKPRWPVPAWSLGTTTPDVIVPASVIVSISGQKRISTRCNSVFVWADHTNGKGADVFRDGSDRAARAGAQIHALYTDLPVHRAIGTAVLSDTGKHKTETVKLPLNKGYAIPRAEIGQIWQFNEPNGYWRGIVTGLSIDVSRESEGALSVWQTLTVDHYMDV